MVKCVFVLYEEVEDDRQYFWGNVYVVVVNLDDGFFVFVFELQQDVVVWVGVFGCVGQQIDDVLLQLCCVILYCQWWVVDDVQLVVVFLYCWFNGFDGGGDDVGQFQWFVFQFDVVMGDV